MANKDAIDFVWEYTRSKFEPVDKLVTKFNKVANSILDGCGDKLNWQTADTLAMDTSFHIGHYYLITQILNYHAKNGGDVKEFVKRLAIEYGVIEGEAGYDEY